MNGFKYLFATGLILVSAVFGFTKCKGGTFPDETQVTAPDGTPLSSAEGTDKPNLTDTDYTAMSGDGSITITSDTGDPQEAKDTWAMFLVNKDNPLPRSYDNYIQLELVDKTYREYYLDYRCAEYMKNMLAAAAADGIDLVTTSAYRSYDYQKTNFESSVKYREQNGMSESEAYAATLREVQYPGFSEHSAGVAVDILSNEYASMDDDGFENTEAFRWLDSHAAEYGFILRYPRDKEDITGIIYEPWHYRFVGVYYANDIKQSGLTMEEYFMEKGWCDPSGEAVLHTVYDRNPGLPKDGESFALDSADDIFAAAEIAEESAGSEENDVGEDEYEDDYGYDDAA